VGLIAVGWQFRRSTPPASAGGASESPSDGEIAEVQRQVSQCRSFSSADSSSEPDWAKAASACEKTLESDPIHPEANSLYRKLRLEQRALEHYAAARKAISRLKPQEALQLLAKIPADSYYQRKASLLASQAEEAVKTRTREDCKRHFRSRRWSAALVACERYMDFVCRDLSPGQLAAPPGYRLKLTGPLGRGEWRPKDQTYQTFLRVRAQIHPRAGVWACPETTAPVKGGAEVDAGREVNGELQKRFSHPSMADALLSYWAGNSSEAITVLQKLREEPGRADQQIMADELRKEISLVAHLFKAGESSLKAEDPERAKDHFEEALRADRKLMGELAERWPSFFSRTIRRDMASHSYLRGRYWADRRDPRRACRIWKLGAQFYRGNLQLLQALRYCTDKGRELVRSARRCEDLAEAMDLAVAGDGLSQKLEQKRSALRCP
jgi:tetratricopeptide (TPR) repeat protein